MFLRMAQAIGVPAEAFADCIDPPAKKTAQKAAPSKGKPKKKG